MMTEDYKQVWAECLGVIKDALGPENKDVFLTWFTPIVPLKLEGSTLIVQVPSMFFYEYIEEHYIKLLRRVIRMQLGAGAMLKYSIVMDQTIPTEPHSMTLSSTGGQMTGNAPTTLPVNINKEGSREIPNPFVIPGLKKVRVPSQLSASRRRPGASCATYERLSRSTASASLKPNS